VYILYGVIAAIILFMAYVLTETRQLRAEHVDFRENPRPDGTLKIIHLSDFHINMNYVDPAKIRKVIEAENPDVIFLTGDYINAIRDIPRFIAYLREAGISGAAVKNSGVYACLGNHDLKAYRSRKAKIADFKALIRAEGIILPDERPAVFTHGSAAVSVTAFPSYMPGQPAAVITRPVGCSLDIALSHNPDTVLDQRTGAFDYMFSGHFHGGQIWAPFHIEYRLLRHERLCKMHKYKGRFLENGIHLYISRGIGDVVFPFRFLSPPEITVIRIPL
jgi:predicted MPP superfamily phosphohydrolase